MEFCKHCENMYFVRVSEDSNLEYFCKQCGFSEPHTNIDKCCIYKRDLMNNYSVHELSINKYLTKDPTLPRLTNINCVNENCLTNHYAPNSALLYGLPEDIDPVEFETYIHSISNKPNVRFNRLDDKIGLLRFDSSESLSTFVEDNPNIDHNGSVIQCSKLSKIDREIIFIKYDSVNMKYLYICSTCNTSWKSN